MTGGTVKRAFDLAPECTSLDELRSRLKKERFDRVDDHLAGSGIQSELKKRLLKSA